MGKLDGGEGDEGGEGFGKILKVLGETPVATISPRVSLGGPPALMHSVEAVSSGSEIVASSAKIRRSDRDALRIGSGLDRLATRWNL